MTELEDIYAALPRMHCKGLCYDGCGPAPVFPVEVAGMAANGIAPPVSTANHKRGPLTCIHLTNNHRCAIYDNRPMVCRLFGVVKQLRCPHGCKPVTGHMPENRALALLERLKQLSGGQGPTVLSDVPDDSKAGQLIALANAQLRPPLPEGPSCPKSPSQSSSTDPSPPPNAPPSG